MPEAAMHEDDRAEPSKDNVRPTREIPVVKPESVTKPVKEGAYTLLGLRILAADSAHVPAAPLFADRVGQFESRLSSSQP